MTCLLTVSAFVAIMYTSSCRKDKCKGVVCQNTGLCSGGSCSCPTGYSGAHCENSTITYQNNSFTDLNMTINGTAYVIPAGSYTDFVGVAGTSISVRNIYTGGGYGQFIDWVDFIDHFPTNGDHLTEPFNVAAGYVYLQIRNISLYNINSLFVNYNAPGESHEYPYLPNDGVTYGIGYYSASTGSEILAESGTFQFSWYPAIPYTVNSTVILTAD